MRPIKFRGRDVTTRRWVYGGYAEYDDHAFIIDNGSHHPVIPSSIGQCTGCKADDGTDIYEGDILGTAHQFYMPPVVDKITPPCHWSRGSIEISEVTYHHGTFWLHKTQSDLPEGEGKEEPLHALYFAEIYPDRYFDGYKVSISVIGDIHEKTIEK